MSFFWEGPSGRCHVSFFGVLVFLVEIHTFYFVSFDLCCSVLDPTIIEDHNPIASTENPVFHFRLFPPMEVSYMIGESPPAKFIIDTKHDGLETVSHFKYWPFWVPMLRFKGGLVGLTTLEVQNVASIARDCNSIATITNGARLSR